MSADPLPHEITAPAAWQPIDDVLGEIADLARSGIPPGEFYPRFLELLVRSLGAAGGAIWRKNAGGAFEVACETNYAALRSASRAALLASRFHDRRPAVLTPHAGSVGDGPVLNPTGCLIVVGPLHSGDQLTGVVEVLRQPGKNATAHQAYADFLRSACDLAEEFELRQEAATLRSGLATWNQWDEFVRAVHAQLDLQAAALTVVNDGRLLVGCDRLTVVLRHGRGCYVEAITGQYIINRRANVVRLLEELAGATLVSEEPLWHPAPEGSLPPQIEESLRRYLDESYARLLAILPLRPLREDGSPGPAIGALVMEQFSGEQWEAGMQQRAAALCAHATTALRNAREHQDIFLLPLWQALGRSRWLVQARELPKTVLAAGLFASVVAALCLIPADFEIRAPAELQPQLRREVYARADGVVGDVLVKHGDDVQAGQVLAELRNTELDFQFTRTLGELLTTRKKLAAVQAARLEGTPAASRSREQSPSLTSEEEELKETLKSLEEQSELLSQYKADLAVTSPIAGRVTTWNVAESLAARPVRRGQPLLSVADVSGPWVVEVHLPDDQAGHVLAAQDELREQLDVWYILATEPGVTRHGTIKNVAMAVESDLMGARSVLVEVELDKTNLPPLRPGASATARIHCGRRAVGYVWFRDLIEFVQSRILF